MADQICDIVPGPAWMWGKRRSQRGTGNISLVGLGNPAREGQGEARRDCGVWGQLGQS
jgi:hypothetical protein